jgi:hypothetical protein
LSVDRMTPIGRRRPVVVLARDFIVAGHLLIAG